MLQLISILAAVLIATSIHAAQVVRCHDGDTCQFVEKGKRIKVRFSGIDAPETHQPLSGASRDHLFRLLKGKDAKLECDGRSYDRRTCTVYVNGQDVGVEMVRNGLAIDFARHSKGKYRLAQKEAQANKRGVWGLKDFKSPACARKTAPKQCKTNPAYQP